MTIRHTTFRRWLCIHFLLLSAFLMQPPLAAGQEPPLPAQSDLAPEVRSRLAEAARDSRLEPWQRDFMLGVARGTGEGGATDPSSELPGLAPRPAALASIDGTWGRLAAPLSGRDSPTAIYDPVRDRMLVFGGYDGSYYNDVWSLSLAGSPAWSAISPAGSPPPARSNQTAIYDPVRDRMVVFGGRDASGDRNDVWALSLAGSPAWSELTPAGSPPPARFGHTAIYDPVRDRMVVFGGYTGGGYRNDAWALSLAGSPAWSELTPAGSPPPARFGHTAIYDPVRDRMVVFGGYTGGGYRNDAWALSLAGSPAWNALGPAGTPPSVRYGHSAIYDPVRDRMVVFGGFDGNYRNDVWELTLAGSPAWSALGPAFSPLAGRYIHSAIYDPVRDRMVVFGGYDGGSRRNDTWALSLGGSPAWSTLASPPSPRYSHTAIYDPVRDRMVVFGGLGNSYYFNDVWALSLTGTPAWSELSTAGSPPTARVGHTAIYDPVRDRMVVFGGFAASGNNYRNDVWALSLAGVPTWSALAPAGTPPSARYGHTAIYDPLRDRMVAFGGYDGFSYRNDTWALSLAGSPAWSVLSTVGTATGRSSHSAIYDPVRDRMVVFGGSSANSPFRLNDAWALSFAGSPTWTNLTPAGVLPSARYLHTSIYDPGRDRMVMFAGYDESLHNDVWALSLGGSPAWSELTPAGSSPSARNGHTAFYDPVRDRMVMFAGHQADLPVPYQNDVWALGWDVPCADGPFPQCGGFCAPGTTCGQFPNGTCGCFHDLPPPCASADAPACNGICPTNQGCTAFQNSCVCVDCIGTDPGEVGGTTWSGKTTMVWDPEACADRYNVYKRSDPRLTDADHDGAAEDYGTCDQPNLMVTEMTDPLAPSPGLTSYFVVTGANSHGEGTMGHASNGLPRPNAEACP